MFSDHWEKPTKEGGISWLSSSAEKRNKGTPHIRKKFFQNCPNYPAQCTADFNFLSQAIFKVSNREIHPRVDTGEITDEVTFNSEAER